MNEIRWYSLGFFVMLATTIIFDLWILFRYSIGEIAETQASNITIPLSVLTFIVFISFMQMWSSKS